MKIAVAGGGPGGLYFAILMRRVAPDCEVTVFERNRAADAFGFGVVFSDETLTVFEHADPQSYSAITERFVHWTDIDIHHRGSVTRSGAGSCSRSCRSGRWRSASTCGSAVRRRRSARWAGLI